MQGFLTSPVPGVIRLFFVTQLFDEALHVAQQRHQLPSPGDSLSCVATMLEGVPIALWRAR